MTWGLGYGIPFGGGPLVAAENPLAAVAGPPVTYDYTDESNRVGLPGLWEYYALEHDGVGVVWSAEPYPNTFFRIADGMGLWKYTRSPALPGPADPYSERGYAASPRGVLEGRDARVSVVVRQPVSLLDGSADELSYNVGIALRLDPAGASWVGARMRAVWQAGVWVTPLIVEVVHADGGDPVVLASIVPTPTPDLLDIWNTQPNASLEVELRGASLTATLNGTVEVTAQVPADGPAQVALLVEAFNRWGASIVPSAVVVAFQVQSLRDMDRLGPPPSIPGAMHLEAPTFPMMSLPLRELLDSGLIKQVSARQFEFQTDAEVAVRYLSFAFNAGEVIRAHEKLTTQPFVPCTRDLHVERSRKKGQ